jgi:hypothetical protein
MTADITQWDAWQRGLAAAKKALAASDLAVCAHPDRCEGIGDDGTCHLMRHTPLSKRTCQRLASVHAKETT